MRETNHSVYYTTAQVKDMVELSDQNVRKYVRLIEDRKYEVAKDEHNRRLFSQEDVAVLKEFIRLAKQPGYTLETAADEIIEQVPHIVSEKEQNMPVNVTNNDIDRMLGSVMEKLDTMQQENKALKDNVHNLVERLDSYSRYNQQSTLSYNAGITADEEPGWNDKAVATSSDDVSDEIENTTHEKVPDTKGGGGDTDVTDSLVSEDSLEETKHDDTAKASIDMNSYENSLESNEEKSEERVSSEDEKEPDKQEEKGVFKKLMSFFK